VISMRLSRAEVKARSEPTSIIGSEPEYPWGLSLQIDNDTFDKLDIAVPEVGQTLHLEAKVQVQSVSINRTVDGTVRDMRLQITAMELTPEKPPIEDRLYDKKA
jgi:hypothetical protein